MSIENFIRNGITAGTSMAPAVSPSFQKNPEIVNNPNIPLNYCHRAASAQIPKWPLPNLSLTASFHGYVLMALPPRKMGRNQVRDKSASPLHAVRRWPPQSPHTTAPTLLLPSTHKNSKNLPYQLHHSENHSRIFHSP